MYLGAKVQRFQRLPVDRQSSGARDSVSAALSESATDKFWHLPLVSIFAFKRTVRCRSSASAVFGALPRSAHDIVRQWMSGSPWWKSARSGWVTLCMNCHPERSEGSAFSRQTTDPSPSATLGVGMTKSGELRVKLRVLTSTTGCQALATGPPGKRSTKKRSRGFLLCFFPACTLPQVLCQSPTYCSGVSVPAQLVASAAASRTTASWTEQKTRTPVWFTPIGDATN